MGWLQAGSGLVPQKPRAPRSMQTDGCFLMFAFPAWARTQRPHRSQVCHVHRSIQHHNMPAILQVRKDGSDDYEASSEGDALDEDEGESEAGGGYQDGEGDPCPNCGRIYK